MQLSKMNDAQRAAAFEKFMVQRETRTVKSSAKRDATKKLIANHQNEFDAMLISELENGVGDDDDE